MPLLRGQKKTFIFHCVQFEVVSLTVLSSLISRCSRYNKTPVFASPGWPLQRSQWRSTESRRGPRSGRHRQAPSQLHAGSSPAQTRHDVSPQHGGATPRGSQHPASPGNWKLCPVKFPVETVACRWTVTEYFDRAIFGYSMTDKYGSTSSYPPLWNSKSSENRKFWPMSLMAHLWGVRCGSSLVRVT